MLRSEEPRIEELMRANRCLFAQQHHVPRPELRSPNKVYPVFSKSRGGPPAWYIWQVSRSSSP